MNMNSAQAKAKADILKALGHPIRVQMLDALSRGDRCVNDLRILATVSQPTISRHLAWLKRAGLVTERRVGPRVLHRLACPGMLQALKCAEDAAQSAKRRRDAND
jgi:ArsR family transcriptional regulator